MQKKVLSEIALYYGDVAMPKDWDIDRDKLQQRYIKLTNYRFTFSIFTNIRYVKYLYERSYKFRIMVLL